VRLITRKGNDCTGRYSWIVESALKSRQKRFVVDGEAVVLCADGIPISMPCTPESAMPRCSSMPSTPGSRWRGYPAPAALDAQDQP